VLALREGGRRLTVDDIEACEQRYDGAFLGISAQRLIDSAHGTSAFALGFARGLNDTPKVMALLVAAGWSGLSPRLALGLIAATMAAGGLLMSRRIAETLGHRITSMNRGLVANAVGSTIVIGAPLLGSPVSTTHVSAGAIFGISMHTGTADPKVITGIVLAWVATLPAAALLSAAVASVL
jgi:PiT family inorganic phosphate transporter